MSAGDLPSKSYAMCCVLEESAIGRGEFCRGQHARHGSVCWGAWRGGK